MRSGHARSPTRQSMRRSPDEDVALCNDVRGAAGFPQLCISEDFIAVRARIGCNFLAFVCVVGAWGVSQVGWFFSGRSPVVQTPRCRAANTGPVGASLLAKAMFLPTEIYRVYRPLREQARSHRCRVCCATARRLDGEGTPTDRVLPVGAWLARDER